MLTTLVIGIAVGLAWLVRQETARFWSETETRHRATWGDGIYPTR